jgi:hypothetical protein
VAHRYDAFNTGMMLSRQENTFREGLGLLLGKRLGQHLSPSPNEENPDALSNENNPARAS